MYSAILLYYFSLKFIAILTCTQDVFNTSEFFSASVDKLKTKHHSKNLKDIEYCTGGAPGFNPRVFPLLPVRIT